ncbi:MAG: histidine phosphatase family protein [Cyanobacteria bacterium J06597_16]
MTYLKVLLMRHAQSVGNVKKLMEGQSSTALSPEGYGQAHRLSDALIQAGHPSQRPTHVYSSPLLRASQTARVLTEDLTSVSHGCCFRQEPALSEMHAGIFQGLTWAEAEAAYPKVCQQLRSASLSWHPVPEAESLMEVRQRAQGWVRHLLSCHQPGDVVWGVSHEGILQHVIAALMGCDRTWKIAIAHTAIFEFWLAETPPSLPTSLRNASPWQHLGPDQFNTEYWQVRRFNDASHLCCR